MLSDVTYRIQKSPRAKNKVIHADHLKPYLEPPLKSWVREEEQVNPLVSQLDAEVKSEHVVCGDSVSATRREENQVGFVPAKLVESVPDVSASSSLVPYDDDADGIGSSDEGDLSVDDENVPKLSTENVAGSVISVDAGSPENSGVPIMFVADSDTVMRSMPHRTVINHRRKCSKKEKK